MRALLQRWWRDESGALLSTEAVLLASIMVVGTVVGLEALRTSVAQEIDDTLNAINGSDIAFVRGSLNNFRFTIRNSGTTLTPIDPTGEPSTGSPSQAQRVTVQDAQAEGS